MGGKDGTSEFRRSREQQVIKAGIVGLGSWGKTLVESTENNDAIRFVSVTTRTVTPEIAAPTVAAARNRCLGHVVGKTQDRRPGPHQRANLTHQSGSP